MELKLFVCKHCGNVGGKVVDKGVPVMCCVQRLAIKRDGDKVTITVGSVVHPMLEEHSITMIAAVSGDTVTVRFPKPGDEPTLTVDSKEPVTAYEICNLHGYWKGHE